MIGAMYVRFTPESGHQRGQTKVPLPTYFLPTKSISADMPT